MEAAPATPVEMLRLTLEGWLGLPRVLWCYLRLWLRQRADHRAAIAALRRAVARPDDDAEPLLPLEPGLYRVSEARLGRASAPDALTVVHLVGTGENVYSPLVGLEALCRQWPALAECRHVIVDTPSDPASYLGPDEFNTRLARALAPELSRNRERLVLVGLSRGAVAALYLGSWLAEVHGTRVGILAMSPPLAIAGRQPTTVAAIGELEPAADNLVRQVAAMPWLAPFASRLLRYLYVYVSGFVLAELRMASDEALAMYARHVRAADPGAACLRAVREFALLGRVSAAELRHVVSSAMRRLARDDSARAVVCWGREDAWVPVDTCAEQLREALERHAVPPANVALHVLEGWNHGVGREPAQDFAPLAEMLRGLCEHAAAEMPRRGASDGTR